MNRNVPLVLSTCYFGRDLVIHGHRCMDTPRHQEYVNDQGQET